MHRTPVVAFFHVSIAPNVAARLEQLESGAVRGGPGKQRDGAACQVASHSAGRAHRQVLKKNIKTRACLFSHSAVDGKTRKKK